MLGDRGAAAVCRSPCRYISLCGRRGGRVAPRMRLHSFGCICFMPWNRVAAAVPRIVTPGLMLTRIGFALRRRRRCVDRMIVLHGDRLAKQSLDRLEVLPLIGIAESHRCPARPRTCRAANAMDVGLRLMCQVIIDHV